MLIAEHAITYTDQLKVADLEYLTLKANRLGRVGRQVMAIHTETDQEGTHVYFDVTAMVGCGQKTSFR